MYLLVYKLYLIRLFSMSHETNCFFLGAQWLPGDRGSPRDPRRKLRLPRRFLLAAFICCVCSKHASSFNIRMRSCGFGTSKTWEGLVQTQQKNAAHPNVGWRRVMFKNRKILGRRCAWGVTACLHNLHFGFRLNRLAFNDMKTQLHILKVV